MEYFEYQPSSISAQKHDPRPRSIYIVNFLDYGPEPAGYRPTSEKWYFGLSAN
jgi:hypothetical protein